MEKRDKKYRAFLIFFAKKLCKNSLKSEQKNIFFCILYMYNLKKLAVAFS